MKIGASLLKRARYLRKYFSAFCEETRRTNKIFFIGAFALLALILPGSVFAQVVISEIMYDLASGSDSGREWVEVLNSGPVSVKLTNWKLFENATNHKISPISGGDTLAAGAYAIIANDPITFRKDWPNFSGQLYKSAFSLSNDGETLVLRDASSTDINTTSYQNSMGAAGDGNSLNRSGAGVAFVPRAPSPAAAMSANAQAPPPSKEPPAKAAPKAKKTTSQKTAAGPVTSGTSEDIFVEESAPGNIDVDSQAPTKQMAAAAPGASSRMWWFGALGIAGLAARSLAIARRSGKKEWEIVEGE